MRVAGITILVIAIVAQAFLIATSLLEFDPRTSCDRLSYWSEWIACMHGQSHSHVLLAEIAIFAWISGGVARILGRFSPPYVSAIVPAAMAMLTALFAVGHWHERVAPYADFGVPRLVDSFAFIRDVCVFVFLVAGPAFGAWLLGLHARARYRSLKSLMY
jgi:hypothetical protein